MTFDRASNFCSTHPETLLLGPQNELSHHCRQNIVERRRISRFSETLQSFGRSAISYSAQPGQSLGTWIKCYASAQAFGKARTGTEQGHVSKSEHASLKAGANNDATQEGQ